MSCSNRLLYLPSCLSLLRPWCTVLAVHWAAVVGFAWEAPPAEPILPPAIRCLTFSPDGRLLVSGSRDSSVRLWGTENGLQLRVLEAHNDTVTSVAFSPDGGMIASGDIDGMVIVWALGSE